MSENSKEADDPGNADLLIGTGHGSTNDPGILASLKSRLEVPDGTWKTRGYLPHFDDGLSMQHITFHLADSLPLETVERVLDETSKMRPELQDAERRRRFETFLDAGHGSCLLRIPDLAASVEGALRHFDGERYRLLAWVVMPNHVHVLFHPIQGLEDEKDRRIMEEIHGPPDL